MSTIIVADDDIPLRDAIASAIRGVGALPRLAQSAEEVLRCFAGTRPDVLVSDIEMPNEDGYGFIRRIRARSAEKGGNTPAAALTAFRAAEEEQAYFIKRGIEKAILRKGVSIFRGPLNQYQCFIPVHAGESIFVLVGNAFYAAEKDLEEVFASRGPEFGLSREDVSFARRALSVQDLKTASEQCEQIARLFALSLRDNYEKNLNLNNYRKVRATFDFLFEIEEATDRERIFAESQPELVYHLAAEVGGIGANRANPGRYWYANLIMGAHVLELARRHGVRKVVVAGTVCAYPKHTPVPFKEDDLWNGYPEETNAPYGVAKKAAWQMLDAYRVQYGMKSAYMLPVNLYGPHDNFDLGTSHVIPALIRKCIEARDRGDDKIVCWGTGSPSREFLYVDDAAEGIVAAAERMEEPTPVNLGTGREIRIRDLVDLIVRLTGFQGRVEWDASKPDGQPRRCLDTSRAEKLLGWRAATPLEEGLRRTIEWYRSHHAGA